MWLQEYYMVVTAEGYRSETIRMRNDCDRHKDVITLTDFVPEEGAPAFESRLEIVPMASR
jgi:hypothetical protein